MSRFRMKANLRISLPHISVHLTTAISIMMDNISSNLPVISTNHCEISEILVAFLQTHRSLYIIVRPENV